MSKHTLNPNTYAVSQHGSNHLKAYMIIVATTLAVASFVAIGIVNRAPATDAKHCVAGVAPTNGTYVLVDLTDQDLPNVAQKERLFSEIRHQAGKLADGDRLEITVLAAPAADKPAERKVLFATCRPRSPDHAGMDKGRKVLEDQIKKDWDEPLQKALESIEARMGIGATTTPLIDSLKILRKGMTAQHGHVTVFSDMLANSTLSLYGPAVDFHVLREQRIDDAMVEGLFAGHEVSIYQMVSPTAAAAQNRAQPFWDAWVAATKASRVSFSKI